MGERITDTMLRNKLKYINSNFKNIQIIIYGKNVGLQRKGESGYSQLYYGSKKEMWDFLDGMDKALYRVPMEEKRAKREKTKRMM